MKISTSNGTTARCSAVSLISHMRQQTPRSGECVLRHIPLWPSLPGSVVQRRQFNSGECHRPTTEDNERREQQTTPRQWRPSQAMATHCGVGAAKWAVFGHPLESALCPKKIQFCLLMLRSLKGTIYLPHGCLFRPRNFSSDIWALSMSEAVESQQPQC